VSIFKRPRSPYWYCEIQVNGVRVVRSTGTDDKREARAYERRLRVQLEADAGKPKRTELTLDQACGRYWLEKGSKLKAAEHEQRHLKKIVAVLGTGLALSGVSNESVAAVASEIAAHGGGAAAVNRCLAAFRQVCRRAQRVWGCEVQPIHWSDHFQKEPRGRVRWLTEAEAHRLLDVCPEPLRLAVEWSLLTGCRKSETYGIRWPHVDFDRGQVSIPKSKTGARVVWLTEETRALLLRCPRRNDTDLVFDKTNARKLFEAAVEAAGLTDFTFHDLRHTAATWLRQGGAPLEIVQRVLGHASITTTQRYAHVDDQEVTRALSQLPTLGPKTAPSDKVIPLRRKRLRK
jgi:integrase